MNIFVQSHIDAGSICGSRALSHRFQVQSLPRTVEVDCRYCNQNIAEICEHVLPEKDMPYKGYVPQQRKVNLCEEIFNFLRDNNPYI